MSPVGTIPQSGTSGLRTSYPKDSPWLFLEPSELPSTPPVLTETQTWNPPALSTAQCSETPASACQLHCKPACP